MKRGEIVDLMVFVVVAEGRSFACAAARLDVTQLALSQVMRRIEERLGLRLLTQTTRSVVPTETSEHPLFVLDPVLHDIDPTLTPLNDLQNRLSGIIRITTVEHVTKTILSPTMRTFLKSHLEVGIQLTIDYGLTDVVSERFDAGAHLGEEMDKDMIAIRTGPDIPTTIIGSPDYFSRRSALTPVSQLIDHQAISLHLPTLGTASHWRSIRGGREVRIRMEGQLLLNTIDLTVDAVIDGHGLTYLPYDQVERAIKGKRLIRILDKFTLDLLGYHLYYPHRRHAGSAFSLFVGRLKYKGAAQHYLLVH